MKRKQELMTVTAVAVTLVCWASAFAGIRAGLQGYGPGELALLRFVTASAVLAALAWRRGMRLPALKDAPGIALSGFLGITVYHVALNYGEMTVTAGAASLLIASVPVFTALLAILILGERLPLRGWAGIALSFSGIALIALGEGGGVRFEPGSGLILLAAVGSSLYFIIQKPYLKRYGALQMTAFAIWTGTLFMLVWIPDMARQLIHAPLKATAAVVYLGVFPAALAYLTWTYALARQPASRLMTFLYLNPALAIFIAWIWLGEIPNILVLIGGAVSVGGVVLVNIPLK